MELTGLRTDELPIDAHPNSWRTAYNILLTKGFKSISNEDGFSVDHSYTGKCIGVIPTPTGYVLFTVDGSFTEIGVSVNGIYTTILRTIYFPFSINHPIEGVFKYNYQQQLIIVWTDNFNTPKLLNLTSLPFAVNGSHELTTPTQIILAEMFPPFQMPTFEINSASNGGQLPEGVIYLCSAYLIDQYDITAFSIPSQPIIIANNGNGPFSGPDLGSGSINIEPQTWDVPNPQSLDANATWRAPNSATTVSNTAVKDNIFPSQLSPIIRSILNFSNSYAPGSISNGVTTPSGSVSKSINVTVGNLDTRYSYIRIFLISKTETGISAKEYSDFPITGSSITFNVSNYEGNPVDINNILIPSISCNKVKTMTTLQNRLILGNINSGAITDYQKYANNIVVNWNVSAMTNDYASGNINDHYMASTVVTFNNRTFHPMEVYGIYIHFVLLDGTSTEGFHIPGRPPNAGDTDLVSTFGSENEKNISSLARRFHIRDTSTNTGARQLGYWENASEVYPNNPNFEIWNGTGQIGTLVGTKVRHHRMPSKESIYANGDIINEVINLNFNNIYIPPSLQTQIQGFYFSYIERSPGNRLVEGEAGILPYRFFFPFDISTGGSDPSPYCTRKATGMYNSTDAPTNPSAYGKDVDPNGFRFYDNNLIMNKPTINPTFVRFSNFQSPSSPMEDEINDTTDYHADQSRLAWAINKFQYIPPDTTISPLSEFSYKYLRASEEQIHFSVIENVSQAIGTTARYPDCVSSNIVTQIGTATLLNFLLDMYQGFNKQSNLVVMGGFTVVDSTNPPIGNIYSTANSVYGGDVFLSRQVFRTLVCYDEFCALQVSNTPVFAGTTITGLCSYDFAVTVYNPMNYNLLYWQTLANLNVQNFTDHVHDIGGMDVQRIVPTYNSQSVNVTLSAVDITVDANPLNYDLPYLYVVVPVKYNNIFTSINNVLGISAWDYTIVQVTENPYLIRRSITQPTDSTTVGWRTFLANDYYEMPRNRGVIWKLGAFKLALIIHQQYSLFFAKIKDKILSNASAVAGAEAAGQATYLGQGDIFDRDPEEILTTDEGSLGTQSQWGCFTCEFGYFFVDSQKGKIFLFNGQTTPEEISNEGIRNQIKLLLKPVVTDNPFNGQGINANYDSQNKRIILCQFDTDTGKTFTISYSCEAKFWVSWHNYTPNYMFSNRNGLYSANNVSTGGNALGVYQHNIPTVKAKYYNNTIQTSYCDIVVNRMELDKVNQYSGQKYYVTPQYTKRIDAIYWQSYLRNPNTGDVNRKATIDQIMVYTNFECSGIINVVEKAIWFNGNSRELDEGWTFNEMRDFVANPLVWVHNNYGVVNMANLLNNRVWFEQSKIIAKFVIVRFIMLNTAQVDYYISNIQPIGIMTKR